MNLTTPHAAQHRPLGFLPDGWTRRVWVGVVVVGLHAALLWAVQNSLRLRPQEIVTPVELIAVDVLAPGPPRQVPEPVTAQAARPVTPPVAKPVRKPSPVARPEPRAATFTAPLAAPVAEAAPSSVAAPAPSPAALPAPAPSTAAVGATLANGMAAEQTAKAPAAAAAPPLLQLPSSDADYLQNPKPEYPRTSYRNGETGKVVHKVWIGTDGKAQRAELVSSSGFPGLDRAAYDTVMRWRYVPGKRNGVAETMPFEVPIHWELRN